MSNEKDDLISLYTIAHAKKLQKEIEDNMWGMNAWGIFDKQPECVICHKTNWDHRGDSYSHPFCKNNLEMLEWEEQRRNK